ncbi:hypothetical protein CEXT_286851 [Caerostris extrusa]|uniref:Uncharacterized protein n=1 Tax=Caerostris extrusa TaxID=172846 RepID=A0AAV4TF84_CAEEX|nr:hypothetical protein CEXT_286851 [Caerostris extrusa]
MTRGASVAGNGCVRVTTAAKNDEESNMARKYLILEFPPRSGVGRDISKQNESVPPQTFMEEEMWGLGEISLPNAQRGRFSVKMSYFTSTILDRKSILQVFLTYKCPYIDLDI